MMPMGNDPTGAAAISRQTPLRDGVDRDVGHVRDGTETAELGDEGVGWFASHAHHIRYSNSKRKRVCSISVQDGSQDHMRKEHMEKDPYLTWFIENLKAAGKSQSGLARHMGVPASVVNKIVNGKRKLASGEITAAASYFGTAEPAFQEVRSSVAPIVSALVVGKVEAGMFREVDDFVDQSELEEIIVTQDERFPNARLLGFDVAGDSMNALQPRPILPGDRLICVSYEDIEGSTPLRDGMIVVVQRSQGGGHMREWSVKQLEIYDDRMEFHPRSTSLRHKPIVVQRDLDADDGVEVRILALVRRVLNEIPLA